MALASKRWENRGGRSAKDEPCVLLSAGTWFPPLKDDSPRPNLGVRVTVATEDGRRFSLHLTNQELDWIVKFNNEHNETYGRGET